MALKGLTIIALVLVFLPSALGCPQEFPEQYQSSCFYFSSERLTWDNAQSQCLRRGGKLAEPKNAEVSQFLMNFAENQGQEQGYYLGGNDLERKGQWVWASDDGNIVYTDWGENQPDNDIKKESCVEFKRYNSHKWNDISCLERRRYICETQRSGSPPKSCTVGFIMSSCFSVINSSTTWIDAKKNCQQLGGELAEPRNQEVNDFLKIKLSETRGDYFFGATREGLDKWVWSSDNSTVTFTDWAEGEPNGRPGGEHCLEMKKGTDYKWNDVACMYHRNFVCEEISAVSQTQTTPELALRTTNTAKVTSDLPATSDDGEFSLTTNTAKVTSDLPATSDDGEFSLTTNTAKVTSDLPAASDDGEFSLTWVVVGVAGGCVLLTVLTVTVIMKSRDNERPSSHPTSDTTALELRESGQKSYSRYERSLFTESHIYSEIDDRMVRPLQYTSGADGTGTETDADDYLQPHPRHQDKNTY